MTRPGNGRVILFADDDPAMRAMVGDLLRAAGYTVSTADSGKAALEAVRAQTPDLAILDYRMGVPNGFAVCRAIKDDPRLEHIPVLILTAQGEVEHRVRGFEAGADDYLAKPFDPRELVARCHALLRLAKQGLDRNPTSGLPGSEALHREFDRRVSEGQSFSLCYLDLDHFKPFHDSFGFAAADGVIQATGRILSDVAAETGGFAGHVGGDDFVLFAPVDEARTLVERAQGRVREALAEHLPVEVVASGRYQGTDREGQPREFPLTRISAAVVRVDVGRTKSLDQLSRTIADAKRSAKQDPSGIVEVDVPAGEP